MKLKNFFYNTSDIFVAIIIVIAAAALIGWRTEVILDYPAELVQSAYAANQPPEPITTPYERTDGTGDIDNPNSDFTEPEIYSLYVNYGDSIETIGNNLVAMGCFDTVEDFVKFCSYKGADSQIQAGNHFFPSNASQDEILEALCSPGV